MDISGSCDSIVQVLVQPTGKQVPGGLVNSLPELIMI